MRTSTEPRGWYPNDLSRDSSWIHRLSAEEIGGLESALACAKARGTLMLDMTREDFPLNGAALAAVREAFRATQERWGLCLIKGLPIDRWSVDETRMVFWGLALHVGIARPQNRASQIMTDVLDEGGTYKTKNGRGYNTNAELDFHMDSCDVVCLLCLNPAKSGGESKIFSSMAMCDEIARIRPDLLAVLRQPVFHSYQGSQDASQPPYFSCPVLGSESEQFAFRTNRRNINSAQTDFDDVPRMSPAQLEALNLMDKLMPDPGLCYSMWLERGDLQLLNNYVIGHSRTGYEDFDEPEKKRHLLRLWLAVPDSQRLPVEWTQFCGDPRAGAVRGGVRGSAITSGFLAYQSRQAGILGMPLAKQVQEVTHPVTEPSSRS